MKYNFRKIEKKWQKAWRAKKVHEPNLAKAKKPFYNLMMFPYPSAEGLHVGNMYAFTGSDVYGRIKRMQGYDVFEPMGLDGFGIHAENYAIKTGAHPMRLARITEKNFYRQLQMIGNGFAWKEKLETYDPEYYRWTQWLMTQLFKRGLAYRKKAPVNWCPSCLTVLADEQVIAGNCERCGGEIIQKELEQWFLKITEYAERLLKNLDRLDWSEKVKIAQRNWIGKSKGALIRFPVQGKTMVDEIAVFTTRPDTLCGASYLVLAPDHPFIQAFKASIENYREAQEYIREAKSKSAEDRAAEGDRKTGIELKGIHAINPGTQARIPVWVADYVLGTVGTGAIMAVPAHDERDFAFARAFRLPIVHVVQDVKPKLCLIIHDVAGTGKEHWFPWLKDRLEQKGWKVAIPDLPSANRPASDAWQKALAPYAEHLNDSSVVIGHGLGALMALQFIERTGKRLGRFIAVAPMAPSFDWRKKKEPGSDIDWDAVSAFTKTAKVNWALLTRLVPRRLVYYTDNDPIVPRESISYYEKELGSDALRLVKNKFHFDEYHGVTDFPEIVDELEDAYTGEGILLNSGEWNGMSSEEAREAVTAAVKGEHRTQYRLRDWLISRQRYWGPPIPFIFCGRCAEEIRTGTAKDSKRLNRGECENPGWFAVAENNLPVKLPFVKEFRPTGTDSSPLASARNFGRVKCPRCGGPAKRETDVSDTFLDSSWYFFRYLDPHNRKAIFDRRIAKKWLPVNMYIGGAEHSVLHLLYTRFITMTFYDAGMLDFEEPFLKFRAHGLLIREGAKISKSKGNVVNPDLYIQQFGADTFRMYLMFLAPFETGGDFQDKGILGIERFLNRVYQGYAERHAASRAVRGAREEKNGLKRLMHQTIKKVTDDIEELRFNTAISALMIFWNELRVKHPAEREYYESFARLLTPFAPHLAQELWTMLGKKTFVERAGWPAWDKRLVQEEQFTLVVQVNGKFRDSTTAMKGISEAGARELALDLQKIKDALRGKTIGNVVFVPDRLINICTKS